MRKLLYIVSLLMVVIACQKEIDMDYHEVEPVVVIEGRVTNEQVYVFITRSRSMNDSVKGRGVNGATVTISTDDWSEQLVYDNGSGYYRSPSNRKGTAGQTYHLSVDLDGHHYEATSTMPKPAPITSAQFVWQPVLKNWLLIFELQATDPEPAVKGYYWFRMERFAVDPKVRRKQGSDPYRWNVFDDRGTLDGRILHDIHCMMELADGDDDEPDEDQLKSKLFDGDTITLQLMTIDRPVYEYYQSLGVGQRMGANPSSNITGGCMGYFAAGSVSHADTVIYNKNITNGR